MVMNNQRIQKILCMELKQICIKLYNLNLNFMQRRGDVLFMVRVTEKARRFDEMFSLMTKLVKNYKDQLNNQQRSLLSAAFKSCASERKMILRDLNQIQKIEEKEKRQDLTPLRNYRAIISQELYNYSISILDLLNNYLLKNKIPSEAQITFLKLKADAFKFIYDCTKGEQKKKAAKQAHQSYQAAYQKACACMKTTHPVRLGLALSFSVFFDGVYGDLIQACTVAKKAFDQGTRDLKENDKDIYQDASTILQMLRDNLTYWTQQLQKQQ